MVKFLKYLLMLHNSFARYKVKHIAIFLLENSLFAKFEIDNSCIFKYLEKIRFYQCGLSIFLKFVL